MEILLEAGLNASRWLQASYPWLESLMVGVSALGFLEFYLLLVLFIYWCVDKHNGRCLAYLLALGNILIYTFKHLFRGPRPFWLDDTLRLAETEGYGVPSGHVASATIVYLYIAFWVRRNWVWWTAVAAIALMALSRVYLGQHFLHDVAGGLVLGLAVLGSLWVWREALQKRFAALILGQRFWLAVGIPVALGLLYFIMRLILGPPNMAVAWSDNIPPTELNTVADLISALAILMGLGTGFILEANRVRFVVAASWPQKAGRYLLGILITFLLLYGLRAAFAIVAPADASLWLVWPLRFVRYFLTAFWAAFYAPMLFVALGLAHNEPAPPLKGSLNRLLRPD